MLFEQKDALSEQGCMWFAVNSVRSGDDLHSKVMILIIFSAKLCINEGE